MSTAPPKAALIAGDVPVDAALPGLTSALDPALVAAHLERRGLLEPGTQLLVRHVRYRPGSTAWITYEGGNPVAAADRRQAKHEVVPLIVSGLLTAPGVPSVAGHERESPATASGWRLARLPELNLIVRRFPHDPVLRRLPAVWSLRPIRHQLDALLEGRLRDAGSRSSWKLVRWELAVVRYKPGRRCVFRLALAASTAHPRRKRRLRLYAQVDLPGAVARNASLLNELGECRGNAGPIAVPRPILARPALGLLVTEAIAGSPLPLHLEREDSKKIVRRLAIRLVDLHRTGVFPTLVLDAKALSAGMDETVQQLALVGEARALGLDRQANALRTRLQTRRPENHPFACLHGDFHPGQVIVRGRRSWLVDFDRAAVGDPMHDVATFLAGLWIEVAEGRLERRPARSAAKVFLRSYRTEWPAACDDARIAWHAARTLLAAAVGPLRQLRPDWPRAVVGRLELAAAALDGVVLP